ncbi:hypothetical protein Tco_0015660 [Tanacetum coccineum]
MIMISKMNAAINRSSRVEDEKPDGTIDIAQNMIGSMIGSLMYLTSSRPDIMFAVCACARYQVNLKVSHLHAMKRILRYLKGQPKLSLWYPKDSPFDLVAYTDSDYAGASLDRKSIIGEAQVDGKKIIITESIVRRDLQLEDDEGVDCLPNVTIFKQLTLMGNMRRVGKGFSGRETPLFQTMMVQDQEEVDAAVNEEMDDSLVRVATTATSLDAEQDRGNIDKTQSKATLNEPSSSGTSSGSGPRRQETMGDTIAQTRSENVSKLSNDPLLARGNTLRSGEDSLKLNELMELCTNLQQRVLDLETTKTTQATEIASLKRRVKKLERRNKSRTHGLKRLYRVGSSRRVESSKDEGLGEEDASKQGRIADIDANEDIYLVNVQTDEDMFGVNDLDGDEVIVESVDVVNTAEETRSVVEEVTAVTIPVSAATTTTTTTAITDVEMTLAQALAELKSAKPKADKVVIQESEQGTTTPTLTKTTVATTITAVSTRPRAKGLVIHKQEQAPTPTISSQPPLRVKVLDKVKGKMVKPEPVKKMSKKELLGRNRVGGGELEEDKESKELKKCLDIVLDDGDDVTIDATPLSTKSPTIVDYKIYKEGKKSYYQIIRADARFKKTEPVNYMDNFLLLNFKTMFEHHVEDNVWKNEQGLVKVLNWKLYDSCRVHCATIQNMLFYLLVEKMYPLTNHILHQMFNDVKPQVDYKK